MNENERKIETLEMKEIFVVDIDVNGKKFVHREGFFAEVYEESKPYAWYYPDKDNAEIGSIDYLYDAEPNNIQLMTKNELLYHLDTFGTLTPLAIMDVNQDTNLGKYYDTI